MNLIKTLSFSALALAMNVNAAELIEFKKGDVATAEAFNSNFENLNAAITNIPRLQLHMKDFGVIGNVIQGNGNVNQLRALIETENEFFSISGSNLGVSQSYYSDAQCLIPVANDRHAVFKGLGKKVIVAYKKNSTDLVVVDSTSVSTTLYTLYSDGSTGEGSNTVCPPEGCLGDVEGACIAQSYPDGIEVYTAKTIPRPAYIDDTVGTWPGFVSEVEIRFNNAPE